jgi:RNA polymerase sigma factor for flagellar operon FliA
MVEKVAEQDLLETFHTTRDPKIREQLVMQSVPLVHYLLRRIGITPAQKSDYEDLVHQGLIGLIDAVDHYDPAFGTRFSTYACARIRGRILDYIRASDWMPRSARKRVRDIQKTVASLWNELQHEPTDQDIAERLGVNLETVQQGMVDASRAVISLDAEFDLNDDQDGGLLDVVADDAQVPPDEQQDEQAMLDQLATAIDSLEERQKLVLSLYYYEELTLKEIGQVLGVSESRVCQLHARAIYNLKAAMKDE